MPCLRYGVDSIKKGKRRRNQRFLAPSRRRNTSTNDSDPTTVGTGPHQHDLGVLGPHKDDLASLGPDTVIWIWCHRNGLYICMFVGRQERA